MDASCGTVPHVAGSGLHVPPVSVVAVSESYISASGSQVSKTRCDGKCTTGVATWSQLAWPERHRLSAQHMLHAQPSRRLSAMLQHNAYGQYSGSFVEISPHVAAAPDEHVHTQRNLASRSHRPGLRAALERAPCNTCSHPVTGQRCTNAVPFQ